MPREIHGNLNASGLKIALIISRFNSLVTGELLKGAMDCLVRHGADPDQQTVVYVPGGWELPLAAKAVLEKGGYDGVVALGCVMKGQTPHNEYIANESAKGLGQLSLQYGIPVSFGVLTPGTLEQALERSGLKMGNKGSEAAEAVIEMINAVRQIQS